jgi:hypothetical protein
MTSAMPIDAARPKLANRPGLPGAALAARAFSSLHAGPVSARRRAIALAIAVAADVLQLVLWPAFAEGAASPFDDALDAVVAIALVGVLGFRPRLALALAIELVPGADLFPTWTAVVLSVPVDAPATLPAAAPVDPR